jgi:hypothetical protein
MNEKREIIEKHLASSEARKNLAMAIASSMGYERFGYVNCPVCGAGVLTYRGITDPHPNNGCEMRDAFDIMNS